MAEMPDGSIYVTASRLQDSARFNKDAPAALPTKLYRLVKGWSGRPQLQQSSRLARGNPRALAKRSGGTLFPRFTARCRNKVPPLRAFGASVGATVGRN